jgi:phage tail sheath protein FI
MKYTFGLLLLLFCINAGAQQLKQQLKDTLPVNTLKKSSVLRRSTISAYKPEAAIEAELQKIVAAYCGQPNTAATWIQVKAAAENILHTYFLNHTLMGTKKEQAYYVKMGTETMSAADLASKKMILVAGIATVKPAEFIIIRVEKMNTY